MPVVFTLCGIAVVAAVALVAVGRLGGLPDAAPQRATLNLPDGALAAADVERVRFGVGFRGYRMDEVDSLLDRVSADLDERDAHIQFLQRQCEVAGMDPYAEVAGQVDEIAGSEVTGSEVTGSEVTGSEVTGSEVTGPAPAP